MQRVSIWEMYLLWEPILWTGRRVILILLAGTGLCLFLYFLRFVRFKHIAAMWNADMPRVTELGGEFAGQKVALKLDQTQGTQIAALEERMDTLEQAARKTHRKEVGDDRGD